jgi:lipoyl(octanoyl) transferase
MIRACADFSIEAQRECGKTGVWVGGGVRNAVQAEKIGAIGVHISRWVTSHGFAFNVSTDLRYFDLIVPCGIAERTATSLEKVLSRTVKRNEAAPKLVEHFGEVFGLGMKPGSREELLDSVEQFEKDATAVPA